jgi:hypothetical protein
MVWILPVSKLLVKALFDEFSVTTTVVDRGNRTVEPVARRAFQTYTI